jgi:ABC-type dipeptide/oligopeptide/nickel transport system permease component
MDYPKEDSKSLYDYSDKSVQHAGYAALTYAAINLFTDLLALIQYYIYHRPGTGGFLGHEFATQQYLQRTPLLTAISLFFSVVIAVISGVLAFFIFHHSRFAVVAMIGMVVMLQLFTWFVAHSPAGTLVSIIVAGFLLRGARRIFQDYSERQLDGMKQV